MIPFCTKKADFEKYRRILDHGPDRKDFTSLPIA